MTREKSKRIPSDVWAERCSARSKQSQAPCRNRPHPFTDPALCWLHGALSPGAQEKAAKNFQKYVREGPGYWEPPWVRNYRIRAYLDAQARLAARHARKQAKKHGLPAPAATEPPRADLSSPPRTKPSQRPPVVGRAISYDLDPGDW